MKFAHMGHDAESLQARSWLPIIIVTSTTFVLRMQKIVRWGCAQGMCARLSAQLSCASQSGFARCHFGCLKLVPIAQRNLLGGVFFLQRSYNAPY